MESSVPNPKLSRPSSSKLLHYGLKFHKKLLEVKDIDPDYIKTFHTEEHDPIALLNYYSNKIKDPPLKINNISHWDNIKIKSSDKPPRHSKIIFDQNINYMNHESDPNSKNIDYSTIKLYSSFSRDDIFHDPLEELKLLNNPNFRPSSSSSKYQPSKTKIQRPQSAAIYHKQIISNDSSSPYFKNIKSNKNDSDDESENDNSRPSTAPIVNNTVRLLRQKSEFPTKVIKDPNEKPVFSSPFSSFADHPSRALRSSSSAKLLPSFFTNGSKSFIPLAPSAAPKFDRLSTSIDMEDYQISPQSLKNASPTSNFFRTASLVGTPKFNRRSSICPFGSPLKSSEIVEPIKWMPLASNTSNLNHHSPNTVIFNNKLLSTNPSAAHLKS